MRLFNLILSLCALLILCVWFSACVDENIFTDGGETVTIANVVPDMGIPGDTITVNGERFQDIDTDSVFINGSLASIISLSSEQLEFIVPDTASTGPVAIRNPLGIAIGPDFVVLDAPVPPVITIDSVRPEAVFRGDSIMIHGQNYDLLPLDFQVLLNTQQLGNTVKSPGLIGARVTNDANTGQVSLVNGNDTVRGPILAILDDPTIAIISANPSSGQEGDPVVITGQNFDQLSAGFTLFFNQTVATANVLTPTSIETTVPVGSTTGAIRIEDGSEIIIGPLFTVNRPPVIQSISPSEGPVGTVVTIQGDNFGVEAAEIAVTFNGFVAAINSINNTEIQAIVPGGASTGIVSVRSLITGLSADGPVFTVQVPPSIQSISPTAGPIGTVVTIQGDNFGAEAADIEVTFNGAAATINSINNTQIQAVVPNNATTGNVVVRSLLTGLSANGPTFTVQVPPSIQSIAPTAGPVGTVVTISGSNFGTEASEIEVTFNGEAATINSINNTEIQAVVPNSATTGIVAVRSLVTGLSANGPTFTVQVPPSIQSISPTAGPVGTVVTIAGNNFGTVAAQVEVTFNGETATINSINNTQIRAVVPNNASTGAVAMRSTVTGLTATGPIFTVQIPPVIQSINPTTGPPGTVVTILGDNFGNVASQIEVTFNGEVTVINSINNGQIEAVVPANATTGAVVVQSLVTGLSATGPIFTVDNDCPVITSISPTSGPVGTDVSINGSNFGLTFVDVEVRLNGQIVQTNSVDENLITFTVPVGATTGIVSVTTTANNKTADGPVFTVEVPSVLVSSIAGPNEGVGAPLQIISDGNGNFLFSDTQNHQIKRIDQLGNVTVFAGTGAAGFTNGPAAQAQFDSPGGLDRDGQGNVYVADVNNHVIRIIDTNGNVSTLAGIGQAGFANGLALQQAQFNQPIDIAINGNLLYISDFANHAIRRLDLQTGQVITVAGNGTPGFNDGFSSQSQLNNPIGIAINNSGDLLIADALNHSIRRMLTASNFLLTEAGFQGSGFVDGTGGFAQFNLPYDLQTDSQGAIYIADGGNHSIRKIEGGITTTIAGTGASGLQDGAGDQAQFNFPTGIHIASDNELWICDFTNNFIRKIDLNP
ncbi:MAG: IPT/TIG domain-containing protein [Bacteroidota bacterium]